MAQMAAATTAANTAVQRMQMIKGERGAFASSDDSVVMRQILGTHAPDGREFDVWPILHVAEDIFQRATPTIFLTAPGQTEGIEDRNYNHAGVVSMFEVLAYAIHKITCELTCKCSGATDAHGTTVHLFNSLSSYTWDAKAVFVLAAFAVAYGEFWLTVQLHTVNPLAKSIASLKQVPDILEHTDLLKPRVDAINNLVREMVEVTRCIIEFKDMPTEFVSPDSPDMATAMAHIPTAVYWITRSAIACAAQIIGLIGIGHEYISSTTEAWELSTLAHKLSNIHGHLANQLRHLHDHVDQRKQMEAYQTLVRLFETTHIDNIKILKALLYSKDDLPLMDGTTKRRVSVDVLRRKIVMFLVSDLDISHEELFVLVQIYNDTHQGRLERHYEIVWLPIIDRHIPWDDAKEEAFNRVASTMPWYYVHHPSVVERAVIKYTRDAWRFDRRPLLVVLDPQGKVVCPNALHMMWIWGSLAYPFTSSKEEALWRDETWRLEFLVDEIDPAILAWVQEGRYVCLYGGDDIEWIRRFTTTMRRVATEAGIPLEMVYVGRSKGKDRVRKAIKVIGEEKLSGYWQDLVMIWFFWVRLESMLHSKMQHGKSVADDHIMQEVMTLLSFDGSEEGWAVISRGSREMEKANGNKLLECLMQFDQWKDNVEHQGFIPALSDALAPFHTEEHCTRLILPGDTSMIKERVVCAECKRPMEKFVLYRCCND